jgi:hypothetical protein
MPSWDNIQQRGLAGLMLTGRRFEDGRLYITCGVDDGLLTYVDLRYCIVESDRIIPTKKGIRVPAQQLEHFLVVVGREPEQIGDEIVYRTKQRELHARYCNDKFGRRVDLRYYQLTERYTGWTKAGISLNLNDFRKVQAKLSELGIRGVEIPDVPDILAGWKIGADAEEGSAAARSPRVSDDLSDILGSGEREEKPDADA